MNVRRRRQTLWGAAVVGCGLTEAVSGAAVQVSQVAIVRRSPLDVEAERALRAQLEAAPAAGGPDAGRASRARALYRIELNVAGREVEVLRLSDSTVLRRSLDPKVARESPYAVALVAVELLELARTLPPAREPYAASATTAPATEDRSPRLEPAAPRPPPKEGLAVRGTFTGGVQQAQFLGHDVGVLRALVGADVTLGRTARWLSVGVRGAAWGARAEARLPRGDAGAQPGEPGFAFVRYQRDEVAVRLATGGGEGATRLGVGLDIGLASIDSLLLEGARLVDARRRTEPWFGLEGMLRYELGAGVSVGGGVGTAWLPRHAEVRYWAGPEAPGYYVVFRERPLDLRMSVSMGWSFEIAR